jgi:hypothetical protein
VGEHGPLPRGLDTTPSVAQMYDYALGGEDNLAVDREVMEQLCAVAAQPRGDRSAQASDDRAGPRRNRLQALMSRVRLLLAQTDEVYARRRSALAASTRRSGRQDLR